jgi:hypothetical protein
MFRSIALTAAAFGVGALFMITAAYIGILQFDSCWTDGVLVSCNSLPAPQIRKEVGLLLAINWSIGLLFLFPAFIFCASQTYEEAKRAIQEMATRKMIVTNAWEPASEVDLLRVLRKQALFMLVTVLVLLTLAALFLGWDFVRVVLDFYDHPEGMKGLRLDHPELEIDWSVAAAACRYLDGGSCHFADWQYTANMVFAAAAYGYLTWFGAVFAIGFVMAVMLLATSFLTSDFWQKRLVLVPDISSQDPRRGFDIFEGFFTYAIAGSFILFAMGYLVTLQNIYLRSPETNLALFVAPFIVIGEGFSWNGLLLGLEAAFSGRLGLVNANVGAVTILGVLFMVMLVGTVVFVLRVTADRGWGVFNDDLKSKDPDKQRQVDAYLALKRTTRGQAAGALANFVRWPISWVRINWLVIWLVIATISLFAVTIGFYIIGAGLTYILYVATKQFRDGAAGGGTTKRRTKKRA